MHTETFTDTSVDPIHIHTHTHIHRTHAAVEHMCSVVVHEISQTTAVVL